MTDCQRASLRGGAADRTDAVIFNEYMHLRWDGPDENFSREMIPAVALLGADCYVIDCGWHDEVAPEKIYPQAQEMAGEPFALSVRTEGDRWTASMRTA